MSEPTAVKSCERPTARMESAVPHRQTSQQVERNRREVPTGRRDGRGRPRGASDAPSSIGDRRRCRRRESVPVTASMARLPGSTYGLEQALERLRRAASGAPSATRTTSPGFENTCSGPGPGDRLAPRITATIVAPVPARALGVARWTGRRGRPEQRHRDPLDRPGPPRHGGGRRGVRSTTRAAEQLDHPGRLLGRELDDVARHESGHGESYTDDSRRPSRRVITPTRAPALVTNSWRTPIPGSSRLEDLHPLIMPATWVGAHVPHRITREDRVVLDQSANLSRRATNPREKTEVSRICRGLNLAVGLTLAVSALAISGQVASAATTSFAFSGHGFTWRFAGDHS